jgi:NB-ARC domain
MAVYGLGGIGKTQTAVKYTYRYRDEYDFVLWITADSKDSIISGYVTIANLLDLPVKNDSDQNLIISAVLNWLEINENWLLVLDGADELSFLKNFIPFDPKGHVLLTSRAHLFEELDITNQTKMEKMSPSEARQFFIKRTGRENLKPSEIEALDKLTYELDYLPLAMEQAGAYIRKIECSFEDYLSSYKKSGLKLLEKSQIVTNKYPKSVATTWILNFAQVEQTSKASVDILFVSAFLNPSQITVDIFVKGSKGIGSVLSLALKDIKNDHLVLLDILEPLRQYSLIAYDPNNYTYDIHCLVQDVLKDRMNAKTQKLWAKHVKDISKNGI